MHHLPDHEFNSAYIDRIVTVTWVDGTALISQDSNRLDTAACARHQLIVYNSNRYCFRCDATTDITDSIDVLSQYHLRHSGIYLNSFRRDMFLSESFFMTFATAISKSSCARSHSRESQNAYHRL